MAQEWLNNPRWQKAVQRLARLDPTRKAIFNTIVADQHFADEEMRNYLTGAKMAADRKRMKHNVSMGRERLETRKDLSNKKLDYSRRRADQRYGLASDKFDFSRSEADKADTMGWWNLGVQGLSGAGDLLSKRKKAKTIEDFIRSNY